MKKTIVYLANENDYASMSISQLAFLIHRDWRKQSKTGQIYFGAVPYLEAMHTMDKITDNYGSDSGKSIVLYFLSNATTWKGETARNIKKELQKRCK